MRATGVEGTSRLGKYSGGRSDQSTNYKGKNRVGGALV